MLNRMQKCGLQENTSEAKILAKTRRDQPTNRNEAATENRSRDRKFIFQSVPSHNITKIKFGKEIKDLSKRSRDLKIKLATRMTKATSEKGYDKGSVVETKGNIQSRIFGRETTLMSRRQLNITKVATSCRDVDP